MSQNATAVAEFLAEHAGSGVGGLRAAALLGLVRARSMRLAPRGVGAVVAFETSGRGRRRQARSSTRSTLHSHVANIGDVRSLVIHPATTSHAQLSTEEQLAAGVTPAAVRLSVGLESIDDILADPRAGFTAVEQ